VTVRRELAALQRYREYLSNVAAHVGDEYSEIQDLVNRHQTLVRANEDLALRQRRYEAESEESC